MTTRTERRALDREIVRLAVPAFLALVAEPLFLLGDAAVVGRLGTTELAGLGVAAVVLQTVVGLCVFLAYGTTANVARNLGAGRRQAALAQGVDGIWLAVLMGVVAMVVGVVWARPTVELLGAPDAVADQALSYLQVAVLGIPALLVMLAATGVLRGLQDTRTPLVVAVAGNVANLVLNVVMVHGLHLGIAGSAIGSVVAQAGCAVALGAVVVRAAHREGSPLGPDLRRIGAVGRAGAPLVVRTLTLRAALLVTAYAVVRGTGSSGADGPGVLSDAQRAAEVATHQLAMTIWGFLAFVLDAVAIAAQAITGRLLGAGDLTATRAATRRMVQWGVGGGVVAGGAIAAVSPVLGRLFTTDTDVLDRLVPVLLVIAVTQPLAGVVFVLDGVLIGAGDGRYLAWAGMFTLAAHAPVVLLVADHGLVAVWVAFTVVFMGARAVVLVARARGTAWMVVGAPG